MANDVYPQLSDSPVKQAAKLARFALAVYPKAQRHYESLKKDVYSSEGDIQVGMRGNSCYLVAVAPNNHVVIAISGTNDSSDMIDNIDLFAMEFVAWSKMHKISIHSDCLGVKSTSGFLNHLRMVYHGLEETVASLIDPGNVAHYWITGHSLGGAIGQLLQFCEPYGTSDGFFFGSPKPIIDGVKPSRKRMKIWRWTDAIPYLPLRGSRLPAQAIIIRRKGSYRFRTPFHLRPLMAAYSGLSWLYGGIKNLLHFTGIKKKLHGMPSHSMLKYYQDLEGELS